MTNDAAKQRRYEELTKKISDLQEEISDLEDAIESYERQAADCEAELDTLREKEDALTIQMEELMEDEDDSDEDASTEVS